jgi:hypothetical protein
MSIRIYMPGTAPRRGIKLKMDFDNAIGAWLSAEGKKLGIKAVDYARKLIVEAYKASGKQPQPLDNQQYQSDAFAASGKPMLDPDMPDQELRLHMGELTANEVRVARAAIRWANTRKVASVLQATPDTETCSLGSLPDKKKKADAEAAESIQTPQVSINQPEQSIQTEEVCGFDDVAVTQTLIRKAFEEWCNKHHHTVTEFGEYINDYTDFAWQAWQAAWESSQKYDKQPQQREIHSGPLIGKNVDTYEIFTEARWAYDRYLKDHPSEVNDAWISCFEVIRPYFVPQTGDIPSVALIDLPAVMVKIEQARDVAIAAFGEPSDSYYFGVECALKILRDSAQGCVSSSELGSEPEKMPNAGTGEECGRDMLERQQSREITVVNYGQLASHVASSLGALRGYGYENTAAAHSLQHVLDELMNSYHAPKRELSRDEEIARIAGVIDKFWQLHSIEPATGFTPEQLAKEICK